MEYNPPKLFYKVVARQRFDETKASEIFKESPFYDYDPTYLDIFYKTDINEKDKVILNNIGDKKNQFEWHSKSCLVISDDLFKEYFNKEKYYSEPTEFLAKLNLEEYDVLLKLIDQYSIEKRESLKGDSIALETLEEKINGLIKFQKKFIDWFIERKIKFPIYTPKSKFIENNEEPESLVNLRKQIPQNTKWKNIVINVKTDFTIEIKVGKKVLDINCSQTKYFINKKTKKPNESWELLLELSYLGYFHPKDYTYTYLTKKPGKPKNRIYALGKALMNEFGISDKPFLKYNPSEGWYPLFKIENHRVSFHNRQRIKRKSETIPKIRDTYHSEDELNFEANRQEELKRKGLSDSIDYSEKDGFEKEIEY